MYIIFYFHSFCTSWWRSKICTCFIPGALCMWPLPLVMSRGCFLRCLYRVMMISRPRELLSSDTNVRLLPSAFLLIIYYASMAWTKKSIYNRLSRSLDMLVIPIILRNVLYTLIVRHAKRELRVALLSYPQSIICFLHTNHKSWLLRTLTNRFLQNQKGEVCKNMILGGKNRAQTMHCKSKLNWKKIISF